MKNSLGNEASLYLKQHANNPVAWQTWGQVAFDQAQKEDKPVLISIGYSSCHWCHVMANESFADPYIAEIMNEHFVCIKVDREERPDVDQVYMEAVQMILQRGGWPLNVFCLPDGRPFFGGTYFPPEDRGNGLVPWPQLLIRIAEHYRRSKEELVENAEAIRNNLIAQSASTVDESTLKSSDLIAATEGICGNHDDQYGGFGRAPKFPQAMVFNFLLAMRQFEQCSPPLRERIDSVIQVSLKAMAHGGLYDQVGGGFARYSVDAHWLIPHFEKMLYDNALLLDSYLRAWLRYKHPLYQSIIEETVAWLDRDMLMDSGLYASSLDADVGGVEGQYYTWDLSSIQSVLGEDLSKVFSTAYGVSKTGNFESNTSVLALQDGDFSLRERLAPAREALLKHRDYTRIKPKCDTKALTAWNCLLASSLAEAAFYAGRSDWLKRARSIVDAIGERLIDDDAETFSLNSVYYADSDKRIEGYLHDYTYYAQALLSVSSKINWIEFGASQSYLDRAERCLDSIIEQFMDPVSPGFYFTAERAEAPVVRRKEWFDNALPSGNAMLLQVLASLYQLTGKGEYQKLLEREASVYAPGARQHASAIACGLEAIASRDSIAVITSSDERLFESIRLELIKKPWRRLFLRSDSKGDCQLCIGRTCYVYGGDLKEMLSNY